MSSLYRKKGSGARKRLVYACVPLEGPADIIGKRLYYYVADHEGAVKKAAEKYGHGTYQVIPPPAHGEPVRQYMAESTKRIGPKRTVTLVYLQEVPVTHVQS